MWNFGLFYLHGFSTAKKAIAALKFCNATFNSHLNSLLISNSEASMVLYCVHVKFTRKKQSISGYCTQRAANFKIFPCIYRFVSVIQNHTVNQC